MKHALYNLLVDNHNNYAVFGYLNAVNYLVRPCVVNNCSGFEFEDCKMEKTMGELYTYYTKGIRLEGQDIPLIFLEDLYKYYARSCTDLLRKYFHKVGMCTYLYLNENNPLFIPDGPLDEARVRINKITPPKKTKCS